MAIEPDIREFVVDIGAVAPSPADGEVYHIWKKAFRRSNYFMVGESFLIVKISRTKKPFWGVGKKYIDFFDKLDNYFLVLLLSPKEGYVYNKNEITYNIDNDYWRLREADQNYKIYPAVIKERNYFFGPKQFLLKIGMEKL